MPDHLSANVYSIFSTQSVDGTGPCEGGDVESPSESGHVSGSDPKPSSDMQFSKWPHAGRS